MGILSFFKKTKKSAAVSKFNFPKDEDLEVPPPPPSFPEESNDVSSNDIASPANVEVDIPPKSAMDISHGLDIHDDPFTDKHEINTAEMESFPPLDVSEPIVNEETQITDESDLSTKDFDIPLNDADNLDLDTTELDMVKQKYIVLDEFNILRNHISGVKLILQSVDKSIANVKPDITNEDKLFHAWHNQAQDVLRKLGYVDSTLFESGA